MQPTGIAELAHCCRQTSCVGVGVGGRHRVDLHVHAWGSRLLATLAAQPSCAADALQALRPRGAEAAGVEAEEGKTTMLLPRLYAGLQKGLEDTGE